MARTKQTARKSIGGKAPRQWKGSKRNGPKTTKYSHPCLPFNSARMQEEDNKVKVEYDISYESSFYAHYFETGGDPKSNKTFYPSYGTAICKDASNNPEYWLSVNFNSKYDGAGIEKEGGRPTLNLVIALDISGSMGSPFRDEEQQTSTGNSKLAVAQDSILSITARLTDNDSFGMIVFDHQAQVLQPLTKWKDTDKASLHKKIMALQSRGGTELTKGLQQATDLFKDAEEGKNTSNRVFFLTDMEANSEKDGDNFTKSVETNSQESIFTTVVGVGMDLTSNIIQRISKTPGCNYANVRSTENFKELMVNEFNYLVTPIGFRITIELESFGWLLEKGYGSPEVSDINPSGIVQISTEFPSPQNDKGERRGGCMLFKLTRLKTDCNKFTVRVKHENLQGIIETDEQEVLMPEWKGEPFYSNLGVRKAVFLVKYTDFMRDYLDFRAIRQANPKIKPKINYKKALLEFCKTIEEEMKLTGDSSFSQEIDFIQSLAELEPDVQPDIRPDVQESNTTGTDYESMKVTELKELLKENGLDIKGTKKQLIHRLKSFKSKIENADEECMDEESTATKRSSNLSSKQKSKKQRT